MGNHEDGAAIGRAALIELGSYRYGGPIEWDEHESLRDALEHARYLVDYNEAFPSDIRVDGVVRWERRPDEHLNIRWRRV